MDVDDKPAYASFDKDAPSTSAFGRADSGMVAACTAPAPLAGNSGKYKGSYFPTHSNNASFVADAPIPDGVTSIGFGLHLVDYNSALDDLSDAVSMQADEAPK